MIYELRIYHMHPGKMDNICRRFADHTLKIFTKHGVKVTRFWTDAQGLEKLYYLCEFESIEAKESAWKSFREDPEWNEVQSKSEETGPIVEKVDSYVMEDASFFAGS